MAGEVSPIGLSSRRGGSKGASGTAVVQAMRVIEQYRPLPSVGAEPGKLIVYHLRGWI
jgi:hypothetical protein